MDQTTIENIKTTVKQLEDHLLSIRNEKGVWDGRLSSSALSTAVASFALWMYNKDANKELVYSGLNWLVGNVNSDGGFGDTIKSKSNLSTTLLCWSALSIVKDDINYKELLEKVEAWLLSRLKSLKPKDISKYILDHYKTDRTFSVPILTMCAIAGRLGENGWQYVPQLPYQFAALPDKFFKWFNLSVVSYAIPALISMGLVRQKKRASRNPLILLLNKLVKSKVFKVLKQKQPSNGGFLEASPLTGFVLMSLVDAGEKENIVCCKAESFLKESIREDGSWPIDTSLTTWVSTLAVNSFTENTIKSIDKQKIRNWLLNQQHLKVHPFTKSNLGGWAWIDLEGGVPDGDDTSGALLALKRLSDKKNNFVKEASLGINWLMSIQNKDGGIPTFCKGWGKLPFDASCPDITAHAIRAFNIWKADVNTGLSIKLDKSINKAFNYLKNNQRSDGSWLPLWFGNEQEENHENPVYGTSQVLIGLSSIDKGMCPEVEDMIKNGTNFLLKVQNTDGGWGGNLNVNSSIEETSLAIKALAINGMKDNLKGINYLLAQFQGKDLSKIQASPIGLYFASLWYYEDMYPLVFALSALNEVTSSSLA